MPRFRKRRLIEVLYRASLNCILYFGETLGFLVFVVNFFELKSASQTPKLCVFSTSPAVRCVIPGYLCAILALTLIYLFLWIQKALSDITLVCIETMNDSPIVRLSIAGPVNLAVALLIPPHANRLMTCAFIGAAAGMIIWILDMLGC